VDPTANLSQTKKRRRKLRSHSCFDQRKTKKRLVCPNTNEAGLTLPSKGASSGKARAKKKKGEAIRSHTSGALEAGTGTSQ